MRPLFPNMEPGRGCNATARPARHGEPTNDVFSTTHAASRQNTHATKASAAQGAGAKRRCAQRWPAECERRCCKLDVDKRRRNISDGGVRAHGEGRETSGANRSRIDPGWAPSRPRTEPTLSPNGPLIDPKPMPHQNPERSQIFVWQAQRSPSPKVQYPNQNTTRALNARLLGRWRAAQPAHAQARPANAQVTKLNVQTSSLGATVADPLPRSHLSSHAMQSASSAAISRLVRRWSGLRLESQLTPIPFGMRRPRSCHLL